MFPEQIRDGLRPWQPLKLYMGGVRENEDWTLRTDTGEIQPPGSATRIRTFSRLGLSFQRSQNGGRVSPQAGAVGLVLQTTRSRSSTRRQRKRVSSTASTRPSQACIAR